MQTQKNWHLLDKLGLLVVPGFLDAKMLSTLRREMTLGQATVAGVGVEGTIRLDQRRVQDVRLSDQTKVEIAARLDGLRPALTRRFDRELELDLDFRLLRYQEGDFYTPHRDAYPDQDNFHSRRSVTAVAFIDAPGERYEGGTLVLYGLLDNPKAVQIGIPVFVEPGMLVAFRSDLVHEVTRVERGERCTLAAWYC